MFVLFVIPAVILQAVPVITKLSILLVPLVATVPLPLEVVLTLTNLTKTSDLLFKVVIELKSNDLTAADL